MFSLRFISLFWLTFLTCPLYSLDLDYYAGASFKTNFPLKLYHLGWNGSDSAFVAKIQSGLWNPGAEIFLGARTHKNWRIELSLDGFRSFGDSEVQLAGLYSVKERTNPFKNTVGFWDPLILPKVPALFKASADKTRSSDMEKTEALETSFSHLFLLSGLLSTYFDFPIKNTQFSPYLGLGFGWTLVKANMSFQTRTRTNILSQDNSESANRSLDSEKIVKGKLNTNFSSEKLALTARLKAGLN